MSRLIDAFALCEYANNLKDKQVDANDIMRFPRVDAVPVVRCKDCKYSRSKKSGIKLHCAWWYRSVEDDDFCSRAKRRKEEAT